MSFFPVKETCEEDFQRVRVCAICKTPNSYFRCTYGVWSFVLTAFLTRIFLWQNLAEFVLVIQRHPSLVTIDSTAYNVRCEYRPGEKTVTYPVTVNVITKHGTIANAAPPPICRIIIANLDGSSVSSANIGESLQLKVEVTPYTVYGGFASNCIAIAVDNSWKFPITDNYG